MFIAVFEALFLGCLAILMVCAAALAVVFTWNTVKRKIEEIKNPNVKRDRW